MKIQTKYSVETEAIAWSQLYISACVKMIINNYSSNIHQLRDVANISNHRRRRRRHGGIHHRARMFPIFYCHEGESME